MPPVIINSTYSIILVWSLDSAPWALNSLKATLPGGDVVNQGLADAWATDLDALHGSSGLAAVQPTNVSLSAVRVRDLRTANQPEFESAITAAGTNATQLLPRQAGIRVSAKTALAGRSFRGGPTIPGFAEDQNDAGGRIAASASAAALAFFDGIRTAATNRGHVLSIGSVKLGTSQPVTGSSIRDLVWDTQRRRGFNGI